jgi:hypothetical protein
MTQIISALLVVVFTLASYSTQAKDLQWHEHKLKKGHQYKHSGGHYVLLNGHYRRCKHSSHKKYRGQVQFFTIPQVSSGTRYGYSASGKVIVYRAYSFNGRR